MQTPAMINKYIILISSFFSFAYPKNLESQCAELHNRFWILKQPSIRSSRNQRKQLTEKKVLFILMCHFIANQPFAETCAKPVQQRGKI